MGHTLLFERMGGTETFPKEKKKTHANVFNKTGLRNG
jgi:hypothetical protein